MTRIALATSSELAELDVDDLPLRDALAARGFEVAPVVWDDTDVDWSRFAMVVIRSTWDYTERCDHFVAWAAAVSEQVPLHNGADVVRWNSNKRYLLALEERGVPIVPTRWLPRGAGASLRSILDETGWDDVVVKPAVSAGARRTVRLGDVGEASAADHLARLVATDDVLVQPYVASIERDGELSLLFIDGRFSHGVRKRPATGDFRVQERFGGSLEPFEPTADQRDAAEAALAAAGFDTLYARVDLVDCGPAPAGCRLVELELIEPSMFLRAAPAAADRFAEAIAARLT